jgi:hypothetical protein
MKFTSIINSFKSGKISKKIKNRQDIDSLKDGCEELENFVLLPNGTLMRRPGTVDPGVFPTFTEGSVYELNYSKDHSYIIYIGKNGTANGNIFDRVSRLFSGIYNRDTATYVRIFDHLGREYAVQTIKNYSLKPWYVSTDEIYNQKIPHDGWNIVQFSRKTIFVHQSGLYPPFIINLIISPKTPTVPFATAEFQVMPWYLDFDLASRSASELVFGDTACLGSVTMPFPPLSAQDTDISIANPNGIGTPGKIMNTNVCLKRVTFQKSGIPFNYTSLVGTGLKVFGSRHGLLLLTRVRNVTLTEVTFDAVCTVEPDDNPDTTNYSIWTLSYWGNINNYPSCVTSFRGRLVFGGVSGVVNRFFMTAVNSNNFFSFQNTQSEKLIQDAASDFSGLAFFNSSIVTDLGITAAFNESNVGEISWIKGRRILHFGTSSGEFQVSFLNNTVALTNMEVQKVSSYSSSNVNPVEGDQKIIYVANDKTAIRSISTNARDYESTDIAISAMNPDDRLINKLLWVEAYSSLFYISNNKAYGVCINEQTQVLGFYDMNFYFEVKGILASFWRSLNTDTSTYNDYSYLYIWAKVGTSYKLLVSELSSIDNSSASKLGYQYLDAQRQNIPTLTNPSNPLWADKEVIVEYNDGTKELVMADSSGVVAVSSTDPFPSIGIRFKSRAVSTGINLGSRYGQSVGLLKRIDRVMTSATKSGSMYVGSNNGDMYIPPRSTESLYEDYDAVVEISNSPDYNVQCVIESFEEHPLNLNSIAYRGVTYEGE